MRFFEHQRQARAQSRRLSWLFALIVVAQIALLNLALMLPLLLLALLFHIPLADFHRLTPRYFFEVNTGVTLFYVLGGWWMESSRLADGGHALAKRIGAQPAQHMENNQGVASSNAAQIQFTNIVQEMAIAANMHAPAAFVLPHDASINAFTAGWDEADSILCITQGALDHLTREELMGLVAHELSHIYEGDTRLNMRLAGMVLGLELLHNLGIAMSTSKEEAVEIVGVVFGTLLRGAGWVGWMAARILKAAISREREFLADARAVQFTRSKDGLGATLRKVLWQQRHTDADYSAVHPSVQHMLLVDDSSNTEEQVRKLLQTHPPLSERITRIYDRPMAAMALDEGKPSQGQWKNPFAQSRPLPASTLPQ